MLFPLRCLFLFLCGLCWVVAAQHLVETTLPPCAQACLLKAFDSQICSPSDKACMCTDMAFEANITACVTASCTVPDVLASMNYSQRKCGAPIRNRGQKYATLSNVMVSISGVFVVIRFGFRIIYSELGIGLDDWAVLGCILTAVPSAIVTVYGTVKHGLGQDIWTLSPSEITYMLKTFYIMASLYFTQLTLLKLTLMLFYMRVFPSRPVQRIVRGTIVFIILWGITFVTLAIFQCRPIHFFWHKWDGLHTGHCLNLNAITTSNAAISIVLDLWILAIPLWQLWGLKMHWKKKTGVVIMFCVGTFVTIVSILRVFALVHFSHSFNASWEFYDVSFWSTVEICVGIMGACLPTLRLILVKLLPALSSSKRSEDPATGNTLGRITPLPDLRTVQREETIQKVRLSGPGQKVLSMHFSLDTGGKMKTSFLVESWCSDGDEMCLVVRDGEKM